MSSIEPGDTVMMRHYDHWDYGEVTLISDQGVKVIFSGDCGWDYWYYKASELEVIKQEDIPKETI